MTGNVVEEVQYYHAGTFSEATAPELGAQEETSQDNSTKNSQNSERVDSHVGTSEYQRLMASFPSDQFIEPGTEVNTPKLQIHSGPKSPKSPNREHAALQRDTAKFQETCRHQKKCEVKQLDRCKPYCSSVGNRIGKHILGEGIIGGCLTCIHHQNMQLPAKRKKLSNKVGDEQFEI
jgi:hypothetical protein